MATEPVTLGDRYRDTLTDYAGVAIARTEFLCSSPEVKLQRLDNDGRPEEFWFDEARLVAEDPGAGDPDTGVRATSATPLDPLPTVGVAWRPPRTLPRPPRSGTSIPPPATA